MTDKTEEQIAKDKAAVDAMKNARANMDAALRRIDVLERALTNARRDILSAKDHVGSSSYIYGGQKTVRAWLEERATNAAAALANSE